MLDKTKYVGTGATGTNKAQVRQAMIDRADEGEFMGLYMAHEMMRRTSQLGMPSPVDGGTLGGTL